MFCRYTLHRCLDLPECVLFLVERKALQTAQKLVDLSWHRRFGLRRSFSLPSLEVLSADFDLELREVATPSDICLHVLLAVLIVEEGAKRVLGVGESELSRNRNQRLVAEQSSPFGMSVHLRRRSFGLFRCLLWLLNQNMFLGCPWLPERP